MPPFIPFPTLRKRTLGGEYLPPVPPLFSLDSHCRAKMRLGRWPEAKFAGPSLALSTSSWPAKKWRGELSRRISEENAGVLLHAILPEPNSTPAAAAGEAGHTGGRNSVLTTFRPHTSRVPRPLYFIYSSYIPRAHTQKPKPPNVRRGGLVFRGLSRPQRY